MRGFVGFELWKVLNLIKWLPDEGVITEGESVFGMFKWN